MATTHNRCCWPRSIFSIGTQMAVLVIAIVIGCCLQASAQPVWGVFVPGRCVLSGYSEYTAPLLTAGSSPMTACLTKSATFGAVTYLRPYSCNQISSTSVTGTFRVANASCSATWGSFSSEGCVSPSLLPPNSPPYRQHSALLSNIPSTWAGITYSWEILCWSTPASFSLTTATGGVQQYHFAHPDRCDKSIFSGMYGKFWVVDRSCTGTLGTLTPISGRKLATHQRVLSQRRITANIAVQYLSRLQTLSAAELDELVAWFGMYASVTTNVRGGSSAAGPHVFLRVRAIGTDSLIIETINAAATYPTGTVYTDIPCFVIPETTTVPDAAGNQPYVFSVPQPQQSGTMQLLIRPGAEDPSGVGRGYWSMDFPTNPYIPRVPRRLIVQPEFKGCCFVASADSNYRLHMAHVMPNDLSSVPNNIFRTPEQVAQNLLYAEMLGVMRMATWDNRVNYMVVGGDAAGYGSGGAVIFGLRTDTTIYFWMVTSTGIRRIYDMNNLRHWQ